MGYPVSLELNQLVESFGSNQRARVTNTIAALVEESADHGRVCFEHSDCAKRFILLRKLMLNVYPCVVFQKPAKIIEPIIDFLASTHIGDPFLLFALMTDRDVLFLSSVKILDMTHIQQTALCEYLPFIADIGPIDMCDPGLDW
jgi:hypothetical protein